MHGVKRAKERGRESANVRLCKSEADSVWIEQESIHNVERRALYFIVVIVIIAISSSSSSSSAIIKPNNLIAQSHPVPACGGWRNKGSKHKVGE